MGQKVHPYGFRLGFIQDWKARWYSRKEYTQFLQEDLKLRQVIDVKAVEGGIASVEIERDGNEISVTLYSSRPGIVIGRGGQRAEELRAELGKSVGRRVRLTIKEVGEPYLESILVARSVAEQIERRISFRRAMKQAAFRVMQAGARGIKISCAGRLGGTEIARRSTIHQGQLPLHTLRANIDYGFAEAHTLLGRIGVKVWIYKGDIVPEVVRESVTTETSEVSQSS